MSVIVLNDGREVILDIWDHHQLKTHMTSGKQSYEHFRFFCPRNIAMIEGFEASSENYAEETKLSPLELQDDRTLPNLNYNRIILALDEEEIIGLVYCHWQKDVHFKYWKYLFRYIDVNRNFRRVGVATTLLKTLDKADFLESKILHLNKFIELGTRYLRDVTFKELKAETYAFIFGSSPKSVPIKPGLYGDPVY